MQRPGERLEQAMIVYEDVRMAQQSLRDINTELDSREFQQFDVTVRAKEHLALAQQELDALAEIMQALHMRPVEDSSDNVLDAD